MANFSNYLENQIVNWLRGNATATPPTILHVALFSSDPTDANTGTELTTDITGAATRAAVANSAWTVTAATTTLDAKIENNAEISITNNSTNSTNVNATHFGVFDSSTGSTNLLFHGQLASTVEITPGSNIKFAPNSITLPVQ